LLTSSLSLCYKPTIRVLGRIAQNDIQKEVMKSREESQRFCPKIKHEP